jgi:CheY-like chemotaxis protein
MLHPVAVVGACGDGPSALEAIRQLSPDVAMLDIAMPARTHTPEFVITPIQI